MDLLSVQAAAAGAAALAAWPFLKPARLSAGQCQLYTKQMWDYFQEL